MLHDQMSHRKARGQLIFQSDVKLEADIEARLREWMKSANKRFADAKTLNPSKVASMSDFVQIHQPVRLEKPRVSPWSYGEQRLLGQHPSDHIA